MTKRKAALDAVTREIGSKLFFQNLIGFLLLDLVILLVFGAGSWAWKVLAAAEVLILVYFMNRNTKIIRSMLAPLEAMGETADLLSRENLTPKDLECLIGRLDDINVSHLNQRVSLPGGNKELAGLTRAINAMLERIDQGYQAQARFVSDVSHELRTPISVIQGYANLLNRWGKDNPQARQEAIDAIVQESGSMASMVEQLLFLVRGDNDTQTVRLEPVDLTPLVDEVAKETRLLDTGREIRTNLAPIVVVEADPRLIKQACRVLVDNAVKYTGRGGTITLSLDQRQELAYLSVTDDGAGIPAKDLDHIFQRFYRTDQSRTRQTGGTGLGLPIADWIAHRHNGWIEVVSLEGLGSRFTLVLPLYGTGKQQTQDNGSAE